MRSNYIKHPDVLALVLCTFERCTGTWAHVLRFQCTSVTPSVSSQSAVIDDLVCAAYSSSTDDFSDHIVSVNSHHEQRVSAHQAHICACIDAHLRTVLEPGTYGVDCEQQSQDLRVLVYMKQQLISWDLQHIALSSCFNGLNCRAEMRITSIQAQLGACCIGSLLNHTLC